VPWCYAVDGQHADAEARSVDADDPVPEVLLGRLIASLRDVLGADLVGIYLYGSYVSGGFDPRVSDLDLVVVTAPPVEAIDLAGLGRMHGDLVSRCPAWNERIEVVYVGRAALWSFRTSPGPLAVVSPGEPFHLRDERVVQWLQNWYLLRETGLTLYGPGAAAVVPPIAWTEFVTATVRYADEVSQRSFDEASPGAITYAVLTMCRALRTVRAQAHGSKQEAAAWTRDQMPEWAWLIDIALRCRLSRGVSGLADEQSRAAAVRFIGLVADQVTNSMPG
jgi:predicted nucleotidyltransferase